MCADNKDIAIYEHRVSHRILGSSTFLFRFLMKCLMPNFLMFSRLPIMLMPYLVLYRLSKWFSLAQGKLSQEKQYLTLAFTTFSQFLILHKTQDFDLRLSSPRQPGHGFLSLVNARHRRQFIPQGAISFVGIAVIFVDLFDVMTNHAEARFSP
jgi:hypothetical protein